MSSKQVEVAGLGMVTLYKRRGTQSMRLSIAAGNQVRVSMPSWAPYKIGVDFASSKREWILAQLKEPTLLAEGRQIGKSHRLRFVRSTGSRITTRLSGTEAYVALPAGLSPDDTKARAAAERVAVKALKLEAEHLLPQRLKTLADHHGFAYKSIAIKQLKGRWGSCDQDKNIVLNCFLMELSWELIDYVIMHELVHTRIMAHGAPFWDEVGRYVRNLRYVRRVMKSHQPAL